MSDYKRILMMDLAPIEERPEYVPVTSWAVETPEGLIPHSIYCETVGEMLFGEEPRITVGFTCETEAQERAILDNKWIRSRLGQPTGYHVRFVNVDLVSDLVDERNMYLMDGLRTVDTFDMIRRIAGRLAKRDPVAAALRGE